MASIHLRRDRRGRPEWPTGPVQSTTGRNRPGLLASIAARKASEPRTWTVTVVCKSHRRSLTIDAHTKPAACTAAIAQYRAETKMPPQTSVLVTECVIADEPTGPEAA